MLVHSLNWPMNGMCRFIFIIWRDHISRASVRTRRRIRLLEVDWFPCFPGRALGPINLNSGKLISLPDDGNIPVLPEWRYVHTQAMRLVILVYFAKG